MSMYRHLRWLLPIILLLAAAPAAAQQEPLTLGQIETLLRDGVTPTRVVSLAAEHHLAFPVDAEAERRLRAAGADDELIDRLRGIVVEAPEEAVPEADRTSVVEGGPAEMRSPPKRLSATGAALLSIPLPGIPLMTRPGPGPLIGVGVLGALGYFAWDAYSFRQDRAALQDWDGVGEAPLDMTMEQADSTYDARIATVAGIWLLQVIVTYSVWDQLTPHPNTIQPFLAVDPRTARIGAGVRIPVTARTSGRRWIFSGAQ